MRDRADRVSDTTALNPGDILVAPITDPSGTPLFVSAGGVVVDRVIEAGSAAIASRSIPASGAGFGGLAQGQGCPGAQPAAPAAVSVCRRVQPVRSSMATIA